MPIITNIICTQRRRTPHRKAHLITNNQNIANNQYENIINNIINNIFNQHIIYYLFDYLHLFRRLSESRGLSVPAGAPRKNTLNGGKGGKGGDDQ